MFSGYSTTQLQPSLKAKRDWSEVILNFTSTLNCTYFQPDLVGIGWSYFNANDPYFSFFDPMISS